jgi:hypothetical protein
MRNTFRENENELLEVFLNESLFHPSNKLYSRLNGSNPNYN